MLATPPTTVHDFLLESDGEIHSSVKANPRQHLADVDDTQAQPPLSAKTTDGNAASRSIASEGGIHARETEWMHAYNVGDQVEVLPGSGSWERAFLVDVY